MSIFSKEVIYPIETTPVLEHFSEFYDSVFFGFLPFFQIDNNNETKSQHASTKISAEQAKRDWKELEVIELKDVEIYSSNQDYPKDNIIYQKGKVVTWDEIVSKTSLSNVNEVNRALKTSIGAYKKKLERLDLTRILDEYTGKAKIWHPYEGTFDVFTKVRMLKTFKHLNKDEIVVVDEFFQETKKLNSSDLTEHQFIEAIDYKDYYVYSQDKDILFTIDWDSFFFLIAFDKQHINFIQEHFEGFVANENTTHLWDWKEGEIDKILNS